MAFINCIHLISIINSQTSLTQLVPRTKPDLSLLLLCQALQKRAQGRVACAPWPVVLVHRPARNDLRRVPRRPHPAGHPSIKRTSEPNQLFSSGPASLPAAADLQYCAPAQLTTQDSRKPRSSKLVSPVPLPGHPE